MFTTDTALHFVRAQHKFLKEFLFACLLGVLGKATNGLDKKYIDK